MPDDAFMCALKDQHSGWRGGTVLLAAGCCHTELHLVVRGHLVASRHIIAPQARAKKGA